MSVIAGTTRRGRGTPTVTSAKQTQHRYAHAPPPKPSFVPRAANVSAAASATLLSRTLDMAL
eukprot:363291-Chlamydomonas_euryale.AAC.11